MDHETRLREVFKRLAYNEMYAGRFTQSGWHTAADSEALKATARHFGISSEPWENTAFYEDWDIFEEIETEMNRVFGQYRDDYREKERQEQESRAVRRRISEPSKRGPVTAEDIGL